MSRTLPTREQLLGLRDAYSPGAAEQARLRHGLAAILASGQLSEAAQRVDASMAARAQWLVRPAWHALLGKGLASAVVVGVIGSGAWLAWSASHTAPPQSASQTVVMPLTAAGPAAQPSVVPVPPTAVVEPEPADGLEPSEALASPGASASARKARVKAASEPAAAAGSDGLAQELALIRTASDALRVGDFTRASQALAAHASRFPSGALGRERRGLSLLVRCAQGSSFETRALRDAFLREAGASPLADRVRRACAASNEP